MNKDHCGIPMALTYPVGDWECRVCKKIILMTEQELKEYWEQF